MKSILDPSFRYVPSVSTDLRKTFARYRAARKQAETQHAAQKLQDAENTQRVVDIMAQRRAK